MLGRVFLGRYEAKRLLGEGGMGKVYLAWQPDLGRQVVVKVMHEHIAADPRFRDRFERETRIMARFQHPYVVALYDASLNDPDGPCIVMEYIRGVTLEELRIRNRRLSPVRVGRLLNQLCEALQAAHSEGIIHRDLKPTNVMVVDPDTPYEKVKVMDFGLAKLLDQPRYSLDRMMPETALDFAVGTPAYICPEQVRGDPVDHRGDLYSVGVMLYELLTGQLPFDRPSTMDIMLAHATEPPPPFAAVGAGDWVPPAVEAVVMSLLAKHPDQRPQSARDLAERYEAALAEELARKEEALPLSASRYRPGPERAAPAAPPAPAEAPPPGPEPVTDANAIVNQMEAWMPEKIAVFKLRGFVQDLGGEVLESLPGLIRVRLGHKNSSWLDPRRKAKIIDMELRLQQIDAARGNRLHITVSMRPLKPAHLKNQFWRDRCEQVFCELRAYLMGQASG
ncbi:MAG: serine/threonine protein kinase [Gemmataceae bacterium]|nr:serine/threonine protein kinase [Gemmataceae bacterium]MDW8267405.1 serine/threonine-protein kinase [Gemmataceae bacterium]